MISILLDDLGTNFAIGDMKRSSENDSQTNEITSPILTVARRSKTYLTKLKQNFFE